MRQARAGVAFAGDLATAYRVCLWSRLASRLLLPLTEGRATSADELYATAQHVTWDEHLGVDGTLAVDFTGTDAVIRDTRFGALRVKDAIVDQFRARHGDRRPNVDTHAPQVRVNAHLARGRVTLSAGPQRQQPAPARLPRRQGAGAGAAQREPRGRDAAVRGVAGDGRGRRRLPGPAVRLGHAAHRGRPHGRRRGPRPAARRSRRARRGGRLRLRALAGPRRGAVGGRSWPRRASAGRPG